MSSIDLNILVLVFYKAEQGGLHDNVESTIRYLLQAGHCVSLVCKSGPFADKMTALGVKVIATDFAPYNFYSVTQQVISAHREEPFHIIHAHPFASRKIGQYLARELALPFFVTMHGKYTDDINNFIDDVTGVFTVSDGIRQHLVNELEGSAAQKFYTMPNGVNTNLYKPINATAVNSGVDNVITIALVTRLDADKQFIIDIFFQALAVKAQCADQTMQWRVIGDGTLKEVVQQQTEQMVGQENITFTGWLSGDALSAEYQRADIVIAPGRCALEAMACGKPVIAIGSKGYVGLIDKGRWQQGVYTNFGGVGNKAADYQAGAIEADLVSLLQNAEYRKSLGQFSAGLVKLFYNEDTINTQIEKLYQLACQFDYSGEPRDALLEMSDLLSENKHLLDELEEKLLQTTKDSAGKLTRDLIIVQNRLYTQLESLTWLQSRLSINGQLPPLRGWATSPDVLLKLHTHIISTRPAVIVEFGSGASTMVIADALKQNGFGKLISIEHSDFYSAQTLATLQAEHLQNWVDLRIGELEAWDAEHLNPTDAKKPSYWYPKALLEDVQNVDLIWVDGPPGATCLFSRYPALPALAGKLTPATQVWMDDTIRQEEKDICEKWAKDYDFQLEYFPLEKGLGVLIRGESIGEKRNEPSVKPNDIFDFNITDEKG